MTIFTGFHIFLPFHLTFTLSIWAYNEPEEDGGSWSEWNIRLNQRNGNLAQLSFSFLVDRNLGE